MYLITGDRKECSGCTACQNICPVGIIAMEENEEGFRFPRITDRSKCISCSACERVCPMMNFAKPTAKPSCYYGWNKDASVLQNSTSGGAFSALCQVCRENGVSYIYGAAYDPNGTVAHRGFSADSYESLVGTKYVQSRLGDVFSEIRSHLRENQDVMFVGTPCQVEGLLSFLGGKYREHLLAVALVCHNTASPKAYRKYCDEIGEENGEVAFIKFRDKRQSADGKGVTTIVFKNGKEISQRENPYTIAFGLGLICRESCNACPFTTVYRNADLTIGDFWGLEDAKPELKEQCKGGVSLLLAHSEKGKKYVSELAKYFAWEEVPLEYALHEKQPQLTHPAPVHPRRAAFLKKVLVKNGRFIKAAEKEILRWKIQNKIKRFLPRG